MSEIYRGYEITQAPSGMWEWVDEQGRTRTGTVDTKGGYKSAEECMTAIDDYRRARFAKPSGH